MRQIRLCRSSRPLANEFLNRRRVQPTDQILAQKKSFLVIQAKSVVVKYTAIAGKNFPTCFAGAREDYVVAFSDKGLFIDLDEIDILRKTICVIPNPQNRQTIWAGFSEASSLGDLHALLEAADVAYGHIFPCLRERRYFKRRIQIE